LLDCDDAVREARLQARGWSCAAIAEALADAAVLRARVANVIDTGRCGEADVAATIARWLANDDGASDLPAAVSEVRADVL
jgi:uncharacterized protein (UPF0261 family)